MTTNPTGQEALIERAADLLERYAAFIRDMVRADDLELHPYQPEVEEVAQDLRRTLSSTPESKEQFAENANWSVPSRGEIARAIQAADDAFGYNMTLTRLVDGEATYTLTMPGYDPVEVSETDEGYALIAERRNKCRADAILAMLSSSPNKGEG